ncbi:MAG: hypothetical protein ACRCVX_12565 [Shewanella sp.]
MSNKLREKVARAVRAQRFIRTARASSVEGMDPPTEEEMLDADAAIAAVTEAMWEPTEKMKDAYYNEEERAELSGLTARQAWQAMLFAFEGQTNE